MAAGVVQKSTTMSFAFSVEVRAHPLVTFNVECWPATQGFAQ
jgi:hypothetical protein